MIWILTAGLALAGDPPIKFVPATATVQATVPSYLLPEPKYDSCLLNTKTLAIVDAKLTECLTGCDGDLAIAADALTVCESRFVTDGREIAGLRAQIVVKDERIVDLRRQRNTALLVATGATLIASGGFALALAL